MRASKRSRNRNLFPLPEKNPFQEFYADFLLKQIMDDLPARGGDVPDDIILNAAVDRIADLYAVRPPE